MNASKTYTVIVCIAILILTGLAMSWSYCQDNAAYSTGAFFIGVLVLVLFTLFSKSSIGPGEMLIALGIFGLTGFSMWLSSQNNHLGWILLAFIFGNVMVSAYALVSIYNPLGHI